jgi:mitochondrial import receptor subunit TOM40
MDISEKTTYSDVGGLYGNPIVSKIRETYNAFSERREALGLSNPGELDNISKEVQRDVFLNNLNFSGLRADITKVLGVSPMFQLSHALSMGSQGLPPYSLTTLYGDPQVTSAVSFTLVLC